MPLSQLSPFLLFVIALAAGALAALGFAPSDAWPLTMVGIAVLLALIDAAPTRRRAALWGWLFGVGHFSLGLTWIAEAFTYQAKMPAALGWVAVIGLSMFLALYVALAAVLARTLARTAAGRVLVLAAGWMLGEWLRSWVLSGFAWNPLGVAWLSAPGVAQLAAFGGSLALSGLMVVAGGALWLASRQAGRGAAAGGVLVAAAAVAGLVLDRPVEAPDNPMVYLIQPNIGQGDKYTPGIEAAHLQRYLVMTRAALAERGSRRGALVLWSESSVPYLVEEDPQARSVLASALGSDDLLLFGGVAAIRDARGEIVELTNSLYVIDARGRLHGRYDKAHLVPLGEYVPARALMTRIGLARLAPGDIDFRAGPGPRTLALPGGFGSVGGQICYEIIFPGAVVDPARRPGWIANISNDAWFGGSGPPQHLAQARMRAIEEGLPIARATPTGISAVIDGRGHLSAVISPRQAATSAARLPATLPPTLFARHGHLISGGFGLLLLVAGLAVDRRRSRADQ
ncbi:apolipoprotein N-acyltransferase [Sandarakinorhabdus sp. DWP1-3-1]|uniref:apolipoprotein N-acyltransferase n=1 Tax=Sandarakinorhabdus sp. DWP1-3-1 TaxID=2804627 RepID=UPI003CEB7FC8